MTEGRVYKLLIALAVPVWVLPWLLLEHADAWDHWSYFVVSLPLMSAAAAYAGYQVRASAWRWPLTLILAQSATALVLTGNLAPDRLIACAVLAAPMMLAAAVGAWLARRKAPAG